MRDICGIQLFVVVHRRARLATSAPTAYLLLQQVTVQRSIFEPGGREFESLRARQFSLLFSMLA